MRDGITFDEQEFMALYNASGTRLGLIEALEEMHGYLGPEDAELKAFTDSCVEKLKAMSDEEYRGMELDSVLDPET
ncbi:MAG: transposon-transfer assisting family protein [Oscillospiraceae bacterium]|jgi:hypothetical protein|nr:transposon-transfer assisting family protein [Oscillospiraceae bacterium]